MSLKTTIISEELRHSFKGIVIRCDDWCVGLDIAIKPLKFARAARNSLKLELFGQIWIELTP